MKPAPADTASEVAVSLPSLLIVDDEQCILDICSELALHSGLVPHTASTTEEAVDLLGRIPIDLVLTDLRIPQSGGFELVKFIRREHPEVGVIVLTQYGSIDGAVAAVRLGALDFLAKPFCAEEFKQKVEPLVQMAWINRSKRNERQSRKRSEGVDRLLGTSAAMARIRSTIQRIARLKCPVLILGESGTGKEVVARAIHESSQPAPGPFIALDCCAIAPTLIESEMFGHTRGSFTGAMTTKIGLFEAAAGGTLFLDEVGDLNPELQPKLLRVLQEKQIRRIGSNTYLPVNARIIAATNCDLDRMVRDRKFRQDLYYRLNVVQLHLPPLRERKSDLQLLALNFIETFASDWRRIEVITQSFWDKLNSYHWPGNIRELENSIARAIAVGSGSVLDGSDLFIDAWGEIGSPSEPETLERMEKRAIFETLRTCDGDKVRAAEILGIGKTTLYRKLKEYRIAAPD